eukprot:scaffold8825_cov58-Phaeocystis_antarctica.AAC.1
MRMFAGEADGVLYGSSLGTCAAAACAAARLTDAMCCGCPGATAAGAEERAASSTRACTRTCAAA